MSDLPRLLFLTVGDRNWASSRMRSYWPADIMPNADAVQIGTRDQYISPDYDAYIWMKTGDLGVMQAVQGNGGINVIEVCDPNWWFEPDTTRELLDVSTAIVAASRGAMNDIRQWYDKEIPTYFIPDRLNLSHFPKRRAHAQTNMVRFIWYGVSINRPALFAALAYLDRLQADGYKFSLTIYDNSPDVKFYHPVNFPIYHVKWDLAQENDILTDHDIALLPPYPGPWGGLKSNNKKLTAWACGLPVTDGCDWYELEGLVGDWRWRKSAAEQGYKRVVDHYQTKHTAAQWNEIITELKGAQKDDVRIPTRQIVS